MSFKPALLLCLLNVSLFAADFENGQAARAVLGQSSFSSAEVGVRVSSLVVSHDRLYAADRSHHILTFDLSKLGDLRESRSLHFSSGCSVCGFAPVSQTDESVMPGVSTVSVWGKTVAVVDTANHRVLIWRDATVPRPDRGPDVVLGRARDGFPIGPVTLSNPLSVALDGKRVFVGDAALHRVLIWNSLPVSDDQPADVVLGQRDFSSGSTAEALGPDSIETPVAMTSDGGNLFVADEANRRILVFSPGDSALLATAIANAASLENGAFAPGTLINIDSGNLSETTETAPVDSGEALPHQLGGVEAILDGQSLPLLAVSPTQVEAQIPYELGNRIAASFYLRRERGGVATVTTPVTVKLVAANPGLFAVGGEEPRGGLVLHGGDSESSAGGTPVTDDSPAVAGEVIRVWATGLGAIADGGIGSATLAGHPHEGAAASVIVPVAVQINGQSAPVVSAKLPTGAVGVYEIQVVVPSELRFDSQARLSVTQNGMLSNTVTFALRPRR